MVGHMVGHTAGHTAGHTVGHMAPSPAVNDDGTGAAAVASVHLPGVQEKTTIWLAARTSLMLGLA